MRNKDKSIQTSTTLEKRRKMTSANYTMGMTALVLAFAVIINLIVSSLSTQYRQIDLTRGDIFTLTDETTEFLDELDMTCTYILYLRI